MSSTINCKCGAITFTFLEKQPRFRFLCPCVDCRQKLQWAASLGGPELPEEVINFLRPLDLCYFSNNFKVLKKPAGKIAFFRLRDSPPDSTCTNLVATCCNTTMIIEHPLYGGNAVMSFKDALGDGLKTSLSDCHPVFAGICDPLVPNDKKKSMEDNVDKYFVTLDKFSDKKDPKLKEKFMSRVVAPVADLEEGFTNFKKLLAEEGGDVTILGLTEGEEIK